MHIIGMKYREGIISYMLTAQVYMYTCIDPLSLVGSNTIARDEILQKTKDSSVNFTRK